MYIDTHLHCSKKEGTQPDELIQNAKEVGVSCFIVSCVDRESILEGLELAHSYDSIYLAVGFHPEYASEIQEQDLKWLESILQKNNKIVAIGEIGLDYHWNKENKEIQKQLFEKQLLLAEKYHLPVVVHTRDAISDTYDILSKYSLKGSIHCFSGSYEMAQKFIQLGYYLGIGGVLTFSNSKLYQVVEKIGLSSLLLETDSPYLAPVPHRGEVNESKYIPLIAEKLSEILKVPIIKVEKITTENACRLFDLPYDM